MAHFDGYMILTAPTVSELADKVAEYAYSGYEPIGGVAVSPSRDDQKPSEYLQAMIKWKK